MTYSEYWQRHPIQRRVYSFLMLLLFPFIALILASCILYDNRIEFKYTFLTLWDSLNDSGDSE